MHQNLMQGRSLRDGGCTEEDSPYREEDLVAEKSHLGLLDPRPYMSPLPPPSLRLKAPEASLRPVSSLRVQTVNVPLMFGHEKSIRFDRDLKGEPPLQKRGLPLAMRSVCRLRVPLGPRESFEHPGTLGTLDDVRAPGVHDGPTCFEEIRPLIRP